MKINIEYTSFSLSKGTQSIKHSERAEWFFKDHNIPYELVFIDFYNEPSVKCIQWDENNLEVLIPIDTFAQLNKYCEFYNCEFIFNESRVKLKFL